MQSQTSSSVGHLHPTLFIQCQRTHFAWFRRLSYRILELRKRNGEGANEFWKHELNLCECKELGIFAFVFANVFLWLVPVRLFAAPCVTGAGAIPRREYIEVGTFAQTYGSFLLPASLSPDPQKSRSNQRQLLPDPIDQIHCIDWENQIQSWCKISESSFPLKSIVGVFSFCCICPNDQSWWSCTQSLIIGPRIVRRQFVSFVIFTGPCTTTTTMPLDLSSFCFCCVFPWLVLYYVLCHFHQSQPALAPQLGLCLYTIRFVFVVCFLDCLLILLFFIFTNNQRFQQRC